jgi:vacuolar protein sorting-associated protein 13A/C
MAKKALLDVLEKTIGKYVLNLDAESLNVAVWSGTIELHALELNVPAVNAELDRQAAEAPNLALPFRVVSGKFESFQVDVPWANLTSKPVVLRASGLAVEMEPHDRSRSADFLYAYSESEVARAQKIIEHRLASLTMADEYRQQANALRKLAEQDLASVSSEKSLSSRMSSSSPHTSTAAGRESFGVRLARRIIENVQVEIRDVRISLQGTEGSAGVTLESLQLATTDSNGTWTFVDRIAATREVDRAFLYKALKISGFGAYLDEKGSVHRRRHESLRLAPIREGRYIGASDPPAKSHSYILSPLSFDATLRQADSNNCIDFPKYLLQAEVQNLSLLLSKTQLEVWQKIAAQIQPTLDATRPLFPEYRPTSRIVARGGDGASSARDWWRYAVRCIGRLNGRRLWPEFFAAFQKRKRYVPLYKRQKHADRCGWLTPLTADEASDLWEIEQDRSISVEGIMTWRNIADAQVEKEREKDDAKRAATAPPPKASLFTSLFGSNASASTPSHTASEIDEPPVSLTVEELKALEAVTMQQVADAELTSDSKLADVKFVLGSLDITLTMHELSRQLAVLDMGTVASSFDVNADGSFTFDFSLRSLEVQDRATPHTLYSSILKNQIRNDLSDARNDAFRVHVAKTRTGDQHLQIILNTFEAVAAPELLIELKRFFSASPLSYPSRPLALNPLLAQSLSGSVDLFYDATEGTVPNQITVAPSSDMSSLPAPQGHHDLSKALIEAWKVKTETKVAWVVDLDIHAPIIIVPENCVEPRANVVVFDLGQLRLLYGNVKSEERVEKWFVENPRGPSSSTDAMPVLDRGSLRISNLTFVVGKNNYWQRLVRKYESQDSLSTAASGEDASIFEPVSLSVAFGIESSKSEPVPRVCLLGTIPLISLKMSPPQLSRLKRIANAWLRFLGDLTPSKGDAPEAAEEVEPHHDTQSKASSRARRMSVLEEAHRGSVFIASQTLNHDISTTLLFVDLRLQRLSIAVASEEGRGIEAHLVSVAASFASGSDSSSVGRLSMGWFWVLDRLHHDLPRRQRFLVHSRLPRSPEELIIDDSYDVLGDLSRQGVFDSDYVGSTELADITYTQHGSVSSLPSNTGGNLRLSNRDADVAIDAKFSSLRLNWNPAAVKKILATASQYAALLDDNVSTEVGNIILSSPEQLRQRIADREEEEFETDVPIPVSSVTKVTAVMEKFEVSLSSALDDLPLYLLSMSTAKILLTAEGSDMELDLSLDDLRVETSESKRTNAMYRNLLGLAPGHSESLLKVQYIVGEGALSNVKQEGLNPQDLDAFSMISLSPMRLVYIQAQVMALVEYSTEGILGALTAQAAASAAAAARDIATSGGGKKKVFSIETTGLEVLLPEAASSQSFLSVSTGSGVITYTALPDPGGGQANVCLKAAMMRDSLGSLLQEESIEMSVTVSLPPEGIGCEDDQAMRVGIDISVAPFILSKFHYAQILRTMSTNIGEPDLCLRDTVQDQRHLTIKDDEASLDPITSSLLRGMTHSGATVIENQRRMYIDIALTSLSLLLCGEDSDDPIITLAAVKGNVSMQSFPAEGRSRTKVILSDLRCTDDRIKATGRQHRTLVYQAVSNRSTSEPMDVFSVAYESRTDDSSSLELTVGSPRIVFIPDAVSDVLAFVRVDSPQKNSGSAVVAPLQEGELGGTQGFEVETSFSDNDQVETTYVKRTVRPSSSLSIHLVTSSCSLILVDLGSNSILPSNTRSASKVAAVSESVVFGGVFECRYSSSADKLSGATNSLNVEFHGSELELFTAYGLDLDHPLQILEPTEFTLYLASSTPERSHRTTVDIRAASLAPVDLMFSMRNLALTNAIFSSIIESFDVDDEENLLDDGGKQRGLSEKQTQEIERLARALEDDNDNVSSTHGTEQDVAVDESSVEAVQNIYRTISVKVTIPEARFAVINDLQGLDEALIRVSVRSMMINGQLREGEQMISSSSHFTAFDLMSHSSILAEFFDEEKNIWRPLLLEPWEVSTKAARAESNRFKSPRPSTTIDVESFPCALTFSEQFLMNIASANRMWSVYTTATSSAVELGKGGSAKSRRNSVSMSLAASAARTLTTSLPYAVENHTGADVSFVVHGGKETRLICSSGTVEYFRFDPPRGTGSGGKRVYGQDLNYMKSVTLMFGESPYKLDSIDAVIGMPKKAHTWDGNIIIMQVLKDGKTTVSSSNGDL